MASLLVGASEYAFPARALLLQAQSPNYTFPPSSNHDIMVAHAGNPLTFRETDEADNVTATYVYSTQNVPSKRDAPLGRVDVMVSGHSLVGVPSRLIPDVDSDLQSWRWRLVWRY